MNLKTFLSKLLIVLFIITATYPLVSKTVFADSFKVVTLGADLNEEQRNSMLKYFKVTKNDANILEITNTEEKKYLGKVASKEQIGSRAISSSYVEPTTKGGLKISTYNLTWVTDGMIQNALITAGIENATVIAAAPFKVSGTAALTGILKGFENSEAGGKINEDKKEAANEEIVVTGEIGEKIGQDEATNIINEVKKEVVKEKPASTEEIKNIVLNVTNNFNAKLSEEDVNKITALMDKINNLGLDFNKIKDQLNEVSNILKDKLSSEEAQGFFDKITSFFSGIFEDMKNFFLNIFSPDNTTETTS